MEGTTSGRGGCSTASRSGPAGVGQAGPGDRSSVSVPGSGRFARSSSLAWAMLAFCLIRSTCSGTCSCAACMVSPSANSASAARCSLAAWSAHPGGQSTPADGAGLAGLAMPSASARWGRSGGICRPGWRRRSSRSAAMAIRRVGSVTVSQWRRVCWAAAKMPASVTALASSARQVRPSCSCRAAACSSCAARHSCSARMALTWASRWEMRARRSSSATCGGAQAVSRS